MAASARLLAAIGRRARKRRAPPAAAPAGVPAIHLTVNVGTPARAHGSVQPGEPGEDLTASSRYVHPHRRRQIAPYPG